MPDRNLCRNNRTCNAPRDKSCSPASAGSKRRAAASSPEQWRSVDLSHHAKCMRRSAIVLLAGVRHRSTTLRGPTALGWHSGVTCSLF
eukprot:2523348-Amphidinium_carterae.1